ncbi:MAG: preprotein translocase subunit TatA [Halosimplex sp.]
MSPISALSPLQMGFPGVVELLVILVVGVIVFGIPLLVVVVLGGLWLRSRGDYEERISELEAEIARLQAEVGTDTATGPDGGDGGIDERLAEESDDDRQP